MDNLTETNENKVPKEIVKAVETVGVDSQLVAISEKYNLHIDQAGVLARETYLVITGATDGADFVDNVERETAVPHNIALQIVDDVNNQIFLKIREVLQHETPQTDTNIPVENDDREKTLDAIENPAPTKPTLSLIQTPERELTNRMATDNFIAKKMSPDIPVPQNKAVNPISKKYDNDPYREPIQ